MLDIFKRVNFTAPQVSELCSDNREGIPQRTSLHDQMRIFGRERFHIALIVDMNRDRDIHIYREKIIILTFYSLLSSLYLVADVEEPTQFLRSGLNLPYIYPNVHYQTQRPLHFHTPDNLISPYPRHCQAAVAAVSLLLPTPRPFP